MLSDGELRTVMIRAQRLSIRFNQQLNARKVERHN